MSKRTVKLWPTRCSLCITVGLPGSGKSTWAAQVAADKPNTYHVSTDAIRLELTGSESDQSANVKVFSEFHRRIEDHLRNNHSVIADACNLKRIHRRPLHDLARRCKANLEIMCFDVPLRLCLERNKNRSRVVPEHAMRRMAAGIEWPTWAEKNGGVSVAEVAE